MHLYLEGGSASFRALPLSHATSPVDSLPQLLSQAILQEKKASPLGSCKRRSHAQASQPRIVSAKGPFTRSPASSSPRQLHRVEELCSTQLSVLLHCVFWGIWLTTGKPQELRTLRRGGLQKALSKAAAFAPSLSQLH